MDYILDTHTFIWAISGDKRLPQPIKDIINNYDNKIFVSVASIWEAEIKHLKNSSLMPFGASKLLNATIDYDYRLINIRDEYLFRLHEVVEQKIHNDPFDHMILSTALNEEMILISHDATLSKYSGIKVLTY